MKTESSISRRGLLAVIACFGCTSLFGSTTQVFNFTGYYPSAAFKSGPITTVTGGTTDLTYSLDQGWISSGTVIPLQSYQGRPEDLISVTARFDFTGTGDWQLRAPGNLPLNGDFAATMRLGQYFQISAYDNERTVNGIETATLYTYAFDQQSTVVGGSYGLLVTSSDPSNHAFEWSDTSTVEWNQNNIFIGGDTISVGLGIFPSIYFENAPAFTTAYNNAAGYTWSDMKWSGTLSVTYNTIPEPSSALLLGIASTLGLTQRRRRC